MKLLKPAILLFVILFIPSAYTQSSSTYTTIGLGDMEYSFSSRRLGIGQLGVSIADDDFINPLNPAAWYRFSKTRIEFGVKYNGLFIKRNSGTNFLAEAEFSGFVFAIPVSSDYGIGIAAGFIPFSNVSYSSIQNFEFPDSPQDNYKITYDGSGGLSRIFLGSSYKIPGDFIIGANMDYYFGTLNYNRKIEFANSSYLTVDYKKTFEPEGFGATVGIISPDLSSVTGSENISDFRLAAALNFFSDLDTDTLTSSTTAYLIDTLNFGKTKIEIPARINIGTSFVLNKVYLISLDYLYQGWSNSKSGGKPFPNVRDAFKISSGFEYRPLREVGSSFWEQIILRAGLSFERTQYEINNEGIDQLSVSGGFSLPVSPDNSLDINIMYAKRGSSKIIEEDIIRLNLGVSLGELWFIRPED